MIIKSALPGIKLHRELKGLTLIETLVSTAILAAIGVALMLGLSAGYKSMSISQEKTYVEALAKSQVEYIKSQEYISVTNYNPVDPENSYETIDIPVNLAARGYSIEIDAPELVHIAGVSGHELQSIAINILHNGNTELTIVFYRSGLAL